MQHAIQCLSVVNNVLNLHNLLLYDTSIESYGRIFYRIFVGTIIF